MYGKAQKILTRFLLEIFLILILFFKLLCTLVFCLQFSVKVLDPLKLELQL